MKIGTVFVTYNPDLTRLKQAITAVNLQTSYILLVDNGSNNIENISQLISQLENIEVIKLEKNMGIAKAQNEGFLFFKEKQYDFVLTLDQDTVLPKDYVKRLMPVTEYENAGIVTGAFVDLKWSSEEKERQKKLRQPEVQKINNEIASGNLVLLSAWDRVGGFDETLFIDYVDFDFDFKLIKEGYFIYRVNNVEFEHEIGEKFKKNWLSKLLLVNNPGTTDHSPMRMYYGNRNRIIVMKRYPDQGSALKVFLHEVLNLREILVMKSPRMKKMGMAILGIIHGIFSR